MRYLVVAHQTAQRPELVERVRQLAADDPEAVFSILVPATPVDHFVVREEGEEAELALQHAEGAKALFISAGAHVLRTVVGPSSPDEAITAELQQHPGEYDVVILSTSPPGVSRWLQSNVHE